MLVFKNYGPGNKVWSVELNTIQERAASALVSSAASNDLAAMASGSVAIVWQYASTLATGNLLTIIGKNVVVSDGAGGTTTAAVSWRDRVIYSAFFRDFASVNNIPGAVNDYEYGFAGSNYSNFPGYFGNGAKDAGGANVTAGNLPVPGAGTSWAPLVTSGLYLYVDPADDALKIYNDTGSTITAPFLHLELSAPTGKR